MIWVYHGHETGKSHNLENPSDMSEGEHLDSHIIACHTSDNAFFFPHSQLSDHNDN
jgi:hypothetical protein